MLSINLQASLDKFSRSLACRTAHSSPSTQRWQNLGTTLPSRRPASLAIIAAYEGFVEESWPPVL